MHLAALVVQEPGDCPEHDAWYGCSICTCEEAWHVKVDGIWNDEELEGGVEAFCQFLLRLPGGLWAMPGDLGGRLLLSLPPTGFRPYSRDRPLGPSSSDNPMLPQESHPGLRRHCSVMLV